MGMSNIVQPPVALDKNSPYSNQCLGMDNMRGSGVYFPNVCLFKPPISRSSTCLPVYFRVLVVSKFPSISLNTYYIIVLVNVHAFVA